ncbi:unnamed protein product [Bursaphelenchus okinawaensis]|uniref:Uncharacterized protein n=1 Tax=Bursaphelenchus okinawaensis TaxID=465554 RepID=A0A811JWH8_9BILA|nr:unnamed protein product [Bursaphelenchus okinawaensis]CAG9085529.1 unnamed protein product [Bursaphelenchus okinawaensis]
MNSMENSVSSQDMEGEFELLDVKKAMGNNHASLATPYMTSEASNYQLRAIVKLIESNLAQEKDSKSPEQIKHEIENLTIKSTKERMINEQLKAEIQTIIQQNGNVVNQIKNDRRKIDGHCEKVNGEFYAKEYKHKLAGAELDVMLEHEKSKNENLKARQEFLQKRLEALKKQKPV